MGPKKRPGSAAKLDDGAMRLLEEDLGERPLYETSAVGTLGRSLDDVPRHSPLRPHKEKGGRSATERDEFVRAAWRVLVAGVVEPERLLLVDECGMHTSLAPIYGYAPRGERLRLRVPRKRGKNTTLLSSMTLGGMGPNLWP